MKNSDWLDVVETFSVIGSIGGAIASAVSQQVAFASIPLCLSVTLSLVNRKRLLDSISQSNQTGVAQLIQENVQTQAKLGTLTEQLAEVQQLTTALEQPTSNIQNCTQSLKEQTNIEKMVDHLREIETCTQTIRIKPKYANAYYNRGISYQQLGDKEGAIGDYTEAIRINSSYAEAYHARGLARAELGNKKGAIEDLREAAKLFFEKGDMANYQTARDLIKKFHELDSQSRSDAPEKVALESLFS